MEVLTACGHLLSERQLRTLSELAASRDASGQVLLLSP